MGPGPANDELIDDEGRTQEGAADQQRRDGPGSQPVETIALIEPGIDHGQAGAEQQHAAPVGIPQHLAVDRFMRRAEIDHQPHQRRDHRTLPVQPLPSQMIDIKADQRGAGIEREADPDRIDRNRRQPPGSRQVAEDDHQRRGHEGAEQHAVDDAERDQRREIAHERDHQRDHRIDEARNGEHAAQPERGRKPRHRRRDEDLRADRRRRQPGALVETEREGAAQIRQADRCQAAVEIGEKRAEQHGADGEQRLRRDAAARERPLPAVATFRHRMRPRRCGSGFPPTSPAAADPAASGPCRARSAPGCAAPPW